MTDSQGNFAFSDLPAGRYTASVAISAFYTDDRVRVLDVDAGWDSKYSFTLEKCHGGNCDPTRRPAKRGVCE
jgi:hypothetical protein